MHPHDEMNLIDVAVAVSAAIAFVTGAWFVISYVFVA